MIFIIPEHYLCNKNEVDHVAQHWTHDLRRIQQFGTMPFEELKGLLSEEDYKKSVKVLQEIWDITDSTKMT